MPHQQCYDGIHATVDNIKRCIRNGHSLMILMRGPPGCGKTFLAKEFAALRNDEEDERRAVILSTDDYFMVRGRYAFDPARVEEFHKKNQLEAKKAMEKSRTPIIIDNTNMQMAHMKPYVNFAIRESYEIFVVEPKTTWGRNPRELAKRNQHNVDEFTVDRMLSRYEEITKFAEVIRPTTFIISRVEDDEDEEVVIPLVHSFKKPPLSSNQPPLSSLSFPGSQPVPLSQAQLSLEAPPGLPPLPAPIPIFSLTYQPPPKSRLVHCTTVGTTTTETIGLLIEAGIPLKSSPSSNVEMEICWREESEEKEVAIDKEKEIRHMETQTPDLSITDLKVLSTIFPSENEEDLEHYMTLLGPAGAAKLCVESNATIDLDARVESSPFTSSLTFSIFGMTRQKKNNNKNNQNPRKTTAKESIKAYLVEKSGEQEDFQSEDSIVPFVQTSSSGPLQKIEPIGPLMDDEEFIPVGLDESIRNIVHVFFGQPPSDQAHFPIWLLKLLHRAANGERLTKGSIYHEDFPSVQYAMMAEEEAARKQQEENDEMIARRMANEERASSVDIPVTSEFTTNQIIDLRSIVEQYPSVDKTTVAELFKDHRFNKKQTLDILTAQFGVPAIGDRNGIPRAVLEPPKFHQSSNHSSPTRTAASRLSTQGSCTNFAGYTDVARIASMNNCSMSDAEYRSNTDVLHKQLDQIKDEINKKYESNLKMIKSKHYTATQHYNDEVRDLKQRQTIIKGKLEEHVRTWNSALTKDNTLDLHYCPADLAVNLLKEYLTPYSPVPNPNKYRQNGKHWNAASGGKSVKIITGAGNNSTGGVSEIKTRVIQFLTSSKYTFYHSTAGSLEITVY